MRRSSSDGSDRSDRSRGRKRLRPSGGYRRLRSFQTATIIYDATVSFCGRFIDPHSRTRDQMVQAARSGRQNVAEGICEKPMTLRSARRGKQAGSKFWGYSGYPECTGALEAE